MTCTDHYATNEIFDLFACQQCGFLFTQNVPEENEMGKYYESPNYISHTDTRKGLSNRLYHYIRHYMLSKKARLIKHKCGLEAGNLLDIGTGTGYFCNYMQKQGWKVAGVEKSKHARDFALKHFNLNISEPETLNEFKKKSFDVITLWHVMEHLHAINETWETISSLLKDKGILVIAVPNPSSFDAQYYKNIWAAYDVPRHIWHFTPSTIQQFGAKHGFILTERYPMPFDTFYISILSEKYKHSHFSFLKGIITGIKGSFATIIKKEQSSSMIYIFRKK